MTELETPEEFVSRVNLHDTGIHGMAYDDEVATVAARDAAIRADERRNLYASATGCKKPIALAADVANSKE